MVILQTFTNNSGELEQAIRRTSAGGSTSMYNAVYIALKDLKKVVATNVEEIRRQAIVLLSDGEDTSSLLPFEEVLDLAKRSETAIYAIGLRSSESGSSASRGFKEAEFVLKQLLRKPAAGRFSSTRSASSAAIYSQISDELSSQYTVGLHVEEPQARRRLATDRRQGRPSEPRRAHQAGLLRPYAR